MCEICGGTGRIDVLDVWAIQRAVMEHGREWMDHQTAESLPTIRQAVRCCECHGPDAADEDMMAIEAQQGGDPFDERTYQQTIQ